MPGGTAYVTNHWGHTPFSDPLTIHVTRRIDEALVTLVHELVHVHLMYGANAKCKRRLESAVKKQFSREDESTQGHLIVNPIAEFVSRRLLGSRAALYLQEERYLPGLARAWKILDARPDGGPAQPIQKILALTRTHEKKRGNTVVLPR